MTTPTITPPTFIAEIGGAIRDELLGLPSSKDVDFSCGFPSFQAMIDWLDAEGFERFDTREDMVTVRAKVPASMPELRARTKVADFVLARKDSSTSDGRRPDSVEPGTLRDDIMRRDFTVNALARLNGALIDIVGGRADLEDRILRFVGDPMERIREDALRVMRGFRFMITKCLQPTIDTWDALCSTEAAMLLSAQVGGKRVVSVERMAIEVDKMFAVDTRSSLTLMADLPDFTREVMFPDGLRLSATMKQPRRHQ